MRLTSPIMYCMYCIHLMQFFDFIFLDGRTFNNLSRSRNENTMSEVFVPLYQSERQSELQTTIPSFLVVTYPIH